MQTYTITNITEDAIENLEFYQMLHGHPADEGNPVVYSVYDDTGHDPGKPARPDPPDPAGTHWNIEDRTLNGEAYSFGEAAGAIG